MKNMASELARGQGVRSVGGFCRFLKLGPAPRPPLISTLLDVHRLVPLHDRHRFIDLFLGEANKNQSAASPYRFG